MPPRLLMPTPARPRQPRRVRRCARPCRSVRDRRRPGPLARPRRPGRRRRSPGGPRGYTDCGPPGSPWSRSVRDRRSRTGCVPSRPSSPSCRVGPRDHSSRRLRVHCRRPSARDRPYRRPSARDRPYRRPSARPPIPPAIGATAHTAGHRAGPESRTGASAIAACHAGLGERAGHVHTPRHPHRRGAGGAAIAGVHAGHPAVSAAESPAVGRRRSPTAEPAAGEAAASESAPSPSMEAAADMAPAADMSATAVAAATAAVPTPAVGGQGRTGQGESQGDRQQDPDALPHRCHGRLHSLIAHPVVAAAPTGSTVVSLESGPAIRGIHAIVAKIMPSPVEKTGTSLERLATPTPILRPGVAFRSIEGSKIVDGGRGIPGRTEDWRTRGLVV